MRMMLLCLAIFSVMPLNINIAGVVSSDQPAILFQHGDTVSSINPRQDLMLGTHAAWTPTYDAIVYATGGRVKRLMIRSLRDGKEQDIVLPVPDAETDLKVQWQWSFSPDGRWLAVRRGVDREFYRIPDDGNRADNEARRVNWIGIIDLKTMQAKPMNRWGGIWGWGSGRCLLSTDYYKPILAIDPENPVNIEQLVEDSGSLTDISLDGRYGVIYDGRVDKPHGITVTLKHLGSEGQRVLFPDPESLKRGWKVRGSAAGWFSLDGRGVAVRTLLYGNGVVKASIRLESIDGLRTLYEDKFEIDEKDEIPKVFWSPVGPERFCYWRLPEGKSDGELVLVKVGEDTASAEKIYVKVRPFEQGRFPLLWSPKGSHIAWLVNDHYVVLHDFKTGNQDLIGKLPNDATSWTWASPRVGGVVSQR